MGWKLLISSITIFFLLILLFFYVIPLKTINFESSPVNSNFSSLSSVDKNMQFYPNMRFPETDISYEILDCPLQKQDDMESAFDIMEEITPLNFYSVGNNAEIYVTCEERAKTNGNLFIAGEGGPTNITAIGNLAVILNGEILLIRESNCPTPNIALHELLHVLGFTHSANPDNIMYNITDCDQEIGDDTLQLIEDLYSIPSYSDLAFGNVSASISGRFLSINLTIINSGLKKLEDFKIQILSNEEIIKTTDSEPLDIGYGRFIGMSNVWVSQMNVQELEIIIVTEFEEINKENNKIKLEIKQ